MKLENAIMHNHVRVVTAVYEQPSEPASRPWYRWCYPGAQGSTIHRQHPLLLLPLNKEHIPQMSEYHPSPISA
jgi:hypothetical protein